MRGTDSRTGKALAGVAHLRQSIRDILTTPLGSRIMRRNYGSRLFDLVDNPLNEETLVNIFAATADALRQWEPRLKITRVQARSINGFQSGSSGTTLETRAAFAALNVALEGTDNDILVTAAAQGSAGNDLSFEILAPEYRSDIGITVEAGTIRVQPWRGWVIDGDGMFNGAPIPWKHLLPSPTPYGYDWRHTDTGEESSDYPFIWLDHFEGATELTYHFTSNQNAQFRTTSFESWEPEFILPSLGGGTTGTARARLGAASADDIIAAINAHAQASTLVRASRAPGSNGLGFTAAFPRTYLTGGIDGSGATSSANGSVVVDIEAIYLPTGQPIRLDGIVI